MSKTVLVIVAHPDDEALGCGGVIACHVNNGDNVHIVFMSDGVTSRTGLGSSGVKARKQSAKYASNILGIKNEPTFLDFSDNGMDSIPLLDITRAIEDKIEKFQPRVIYTHHLGDLNIDHQITHKAVMTACRPQPNFCVKEIYAFEVLSSTEWQTPGYLPFAPNVFIDISEYIEVKRKALEAYSEEMRQPPHSRSVKNTLRLNALRGNAVGVKYAESFVLLREVK